MNYGVFRRVNEIMTHFKQLKEKYWIVVLFAIFIGSFLLDIYLLTRYNLFYGRDGAFYGVQVMSIIKTGLPLLESPPLAYYLFAPFVMITGNAIIGIKIAVSFFGSLMVFPAYYLTEMFNRKGSKIPSLLSAFLITINVSYFALIGDYLQNFIGVLFLLLFISVFVNWLQNTKNRKYGILTIILLICNIFTHIYTGVLAVVIFLIVILLNVIIKAIKTKSLPKFDLTIFAVAVALILGVLAVMFIAYPGMFNIFLDVTSYVNGSTTSTVTGMPVGSNYMVFLTIPFLLGLLATIRIFYKSIKEKLSSQNRDNTTYTSNGSVLPRKGMLSITYLVMTTLLILFSVMSTEYQNRFLLLSFIPIALLVPLGLQLIDELINKKFTTSKKNIRIGIIAIIAILFAISSLYTASAEFSSMGPNISQEQYSALSQIKINHIDNATEPVVVVVREYHIGYWAQFVLGTEVVSESLNGENNSFANNYSNHTIYYLEMDETQDMENSFSNSNQLWNPLLPYSFLIGFDINSNSQNSEPGGQPGDNASNGGEPDNNVSEPPTNGTSPSNNGSAPPDGENNMSMDGNPPSNNGTTIPNQENNTNMEGNDMNTFDFSIGNATKTLVFTSNNVKLYLITY